ncbi:hypothetical protein [Streptomyces sp. 900105245]
MSAALRRNNAAHRNVAPNSGDSGGSSLIRRRFNAHRIAKQKGVASSSAAKTAVTAAALAATAYARVLGRKIEFASSVDPHDLEEATQHPFDADKTQRQLACVQWVVPALTGCLVVFNALQGE